MCLLLYKFEESINNLKALSKTSILQNMNYIFSIILLILISQNLFSQTTSIIKPHDLVEISNSKPYLDEHWTHKYYFKTNDGVLAIKHFEMHNSKTVTIQLFDEELNEIKRNTFELDPEALSVNIKMIDDKLYLFTLIYLKKEKSMEGINYQFDFSKLNFTLFSDKTNFVGAKIQSEISFQPSKNTQTHNYRDLLSSNNSNCLLSFSFPVNPPSNQIDIYNESLEKIFNCKVETNDIMPVKSGPNALFSNSKIYSINKDYRVKQTVKNRDDVQSFDWILTTVDSNGGQTASKIDLSDGKVVQNLKLDETDDGKIYCSGVYSENSINFGVFVSEILADGLFSNPSYYKFDKDFENKYASMLMEGGKDAKYELGFDKLSINRCEKLADGGLLISCELFYFNVYENHDGGAQGMNKMNDIILLKTDENLEVQWIEKLPKRSRFGSFKTFLTSMHAFVIYEDNPNNINLKVNDSPLYPSNENKCLIAQRFNIDDGKYESFVLMDLTKVNDFLVYYFDLNKIIRLSETSFLIEQYIRDHKDVLFKVDFSELD